MKKFTRLLAMILMLSFALGIVSCAESGAMGGGYGGGYGGGFKGDSFTGDVPSAPSDGEGGLESDEGTDDVVEDTKPNENIYLPSGMITAGAWNDNDYYSAWLDLFRSEKDAEGAEGKFSVFYKDGRTAWACFDSLHRIKVTVKNGENAVVGAEVVAYGSQGEVLYRAVTDAVGNAYLFTDEEYGTIAVNSGAGSATAEFTPDSRNISLTLDASAEKLNVIELMFVVDVTGSMGDEIRFLKAEIADVISKIAQNDSETVIKLAFLFYRDSDDKVPFYYCDFENVTTAEGMNKIQAELSAQSATGGGDYEEAVDEALLMAVDKQWSTGATTKLIFHVLDAPPHNGAIYEERMCEAISRAAQLGIRICPVLCSGASLLTEYTMREAAIQTGGTFIFVTDDSGIGGTHYDPNLPNVTVELLNSLLVRLVKGYHTGTFEVPVYWKEDPNLNQNK